EKLGMGYILAPPMVLYLIVSIILFIWVQSANQAIIRADKADSTAELSKQLAHKEYAYNMRLQRILAEIQANIAAIEADPRRPIVLGEGSTEDQRTIHGFLNNYR